MKNDFPREMINALFQRYTNANSVEKMPSFFGDCVKINAWYDYSSAKSFMIYRKHETLIFSGVSFYYATTLNVGEDRVINLWDYYSNRNILINRNTSEYFFTDMTDLSFSISSPKAKIELNDSYIELKSWDHLKDLISIKERR